LVCLLWIIREDFRKYADFCFKTFGDRVKHWVTLNEPLSYSLNGYNGGTFAPGRCSKYAGNCTAGDSATEPYIVGHNLLLAHESAATLYKTKYQVSFKNIFLKIKMRNSSLYYYCYYYRFFLQNISYFVDEHI